jgi:hypothetical protein
MTKKTAARVRLLAKYGMTLADYAALLAYQGGVCAITGQPPKPGKNLNVDHDHAKMRVRGLLSFFANRRLLGRGRENAEMHRRAADYLMVPPAEDLGGFVVPKRKRKRRKQ